MLLLLGVSRLVFKPASPTSSLYKVGTPSLGDWRFRVLDRAFPKKSGSWSIGFLFLAFFVFIMPSILDVVVVVKVSLNRGRSRILRLLKASLTLAAADLHFLTKQTIKWLSRVCSLLSDRALALDTNGNGRLFR